MSRESSATRVPLHGLGLFTMMLGIALGVAGCTQSSAPSATSEFDEETIAAPSATLIATSSSPSTTIAVSVTLEGSGATTSDPFQLGAGDYLMEWKRSSSSCGYTVEMKGFDHDENPLRGPRGGSSPDGFSFTGHVRGGQYVIQVVTGGEWRFSATPA